MKRPPDILWIVATQWRAQACGYAGDVNARTPFLDALAARSVNYTQAVTPHPFGPFARAAMLTGVRSPENGVRDYFDPLPIYRMDERPSGPEPKGRTIAHALRERGYATGFIGKWHLAPRDPRAPLVGDAHARTMVPPEARGGFSFWEGFESGFLLNDPWLHGTDIQQPRRFEGYQSDVLAEQAATWIARQNAVELGSWFAILSLEPPHPPYDAPAAGIPPRDPREIMLPANVPRGGDVEARARRELTGYYAHIEATDRAIGKAVATIDAAAEQYGRAHPIIVFTSVHGDMHGAHGLFRKGWPHEESVRVPLLVREGVHGNGKGLNGERRDGAVSLEELPRMTLEWASGHGPAAAPRSSFAQISMPSVVALPHQCDRAWSGVRTPTRKLALNPDGSPWLLFDLANDPLETRNLVAESEWSSEIEELRQRIDTNQ